jgi:hypothetical protein
MFATPRFAEVLNKLKGDMAKVEADALADRTSCSAIQNGWHTEL